eukprot:CAMPEP_0184692982 /NCGR_PEP_ID=MMETSP0313-20130426/1298_1 /TAXON_ID=2792 /ORGANISM="Porphyridium aerugineum, Strain SAG 1380-2" /LENGTH=342 /DNA_ID=CAMNT_0027150919 /DNA_START=143 /DNA_END=1171 /DNA_ORIENTATION=+
MNFLNKLEKLADQLNLDDKGDKQHGKRSAAGTHGSTSSDTGAGALLSMLGEVIKHRKSPGWGTVKPTEAPKWQNSNIGGVGSERDKALRKTAAETEHEFDGAGEELGIEIWRVEKFKPVRQPKNTYGKFHSGDSYIVLHTYQKPGEAKYRWDLFYWQGEESTNDEKGASAYYTVNLDDKLDTMPVQYREVQSHESEEFKALFKGKLEYASGGIGAGWQEGGVAFTGTPDKTTFSGDSNDTIGKKLPKKLFRISDESGNVKLSQEDQGTTVSKSKLQDNDPFALVVGDEHVYIWIGHNCSPEERLFVMDSTDYLLEQMGLSKYVPVTYVKEGNEPAQWKAYVV